MKRKKTRLIIVASVLVLSLLTIVGIILFRGVFSKSDRVTTSKEGDITRYEWMDILCESWGMTEYENNEPYFTDVEKNNEHFAYLQSAVEHGVLDADSKFNGEALASGKFIALTVMRTMGQQKLQMFLGNDDDVTDETYLDVAIEEGIVAKEEFNKGYTQEECEQLLETYQKVYFNDMWQDDYVDVTYQSNVTELSSADIIKYEDDYSEITVSQDAASVFEVGNIVVFEKNNSKIKMAKKITGISSDGTLQLGDVNLDEVIEELVVSDKTEVTFDDVVNLYGVTEDEIASNNISHNNANGVINTKIFSNNSQSKGWKVSVSTEEDEDSEDGSKHLEIEFTNNETGISYKMPEVIPVEDDATYSAELDIDKFDIGTQVKYSFAHGVEYIDVAMDTHANLEANIEAEAEKKILIAEIPVPVGDGLVSINVPLYLIVSIKGGIYFKAEVPVTADICYTKGSGFKKSKFNYSVDDPMVEAACEWQLTDRAEIVVKILETIDVIDLEVDSAFKESLKVTTHLNSQVCSDITECWPLLTISVCKDDDIKSLIGELGLSAEWELLTEDNTLWKTNLHYERLPDGTTQFVDECTYNEDETENEQQETLTENTTENTTDEASQQKDSTKKAGGISGYGGEPYVDDGKMKPSDVSRFYGYGVHLKFQMEYKLDEEGYYIFTRSDEGDYYLVKGTLICPEYVDSVMDVQSWKSGDHIVTRSGRGYTVTGIEEDDVDKRHTIKLLGDDGKNYKIVNVESFLVDDMTGEPYYMIEKEAGSEVGICFENVVLRIEHDRFSFWAEDPMFQGVATWSCAFDIRFAEDGTVDVLGIAESYEYDDYMPFVEDTLD